MLSLVLNHSDLYKDVFFHTGCQVSKKVTSLGDETATVCRSAAEICLL